MKPQVRTKNSSARGLRAKHGGIGEFPVRSIVRLGSRTPTENAFPKSYGRRRIIEINTVDSIETSRDKLLMKAAFAEAQVPQANWYTTGTNGYNVRGGTEHINISALPYPILAKRICGFKGHGMVKLDTQAELENWRMSNNTNGYYFEEFKNYAREYRLHCTAEGCFMAWRKLRRQETAEDRRWFFNSENCNWVGEAHELFDRPSNFEAIEQHCIAALASVGLDIGSFDVRIQSSRNNPPAYILVEVNSAPSLGEQGVEMYKEILAGLINTKIAQ